MIMPFETTWMDLESIMLSEMSDKDRCHIISLIREIKKKTVEET